MNFQVTKVKDKAVLHDQEMHKTSDPMLSSRMLYSFNQSNDDECYRKGNDISQVLFAATVLIILLLNLMLLIGKVLNLSILGTRFRLLRKIQY